MNVPLRLTHAFLLATSLAGAVAGTATCSGDTPSGPGPTARDSLVPGMPNGYRNRYYNGMRYGLFVPPSYSASKSYPLIIYLHGSTDTTTWDLGWYHDPVQTTDPVFVITPKSLHANAGWGTSWDPGIATDMQFALEILAGIQREFSIDTARLYVHGTSMGGFGVFNVLSRRPGLFAGAYAVCGGGTPATAAQMMVTPLWIFHGSADPVVSVTYSREIYQAIRDAGGTQVRYTEYPGVGHDAWTPVGQEATLDRWLLAQRKGSSHASPDSVRDLGAVAGAGRVALSWTPPADTISADHAIWFYRVYRDGAVVAEVEVRAYSDATATAGRTYDYAVASVNYFFRESGRTLVQGRL